MKVIKPINLTLDLTSDEYYLIKTMCDFIVMHCNEQPFTDQFDKCDIKKIIAMFDSMEEL